MSLTVNPNIASPKTIPVDFCLREDYYEQSSKEKIFAHTWQWVGERSRLGDAGELSGTIHR